MSAEKGGQPPPLPAARSSRGRFARAWVAIENALALASFTALGGVVFLQFFTRYALNNPFGWTEEIARYLLIVAAYFGCVVAARRDSHIRLELAQRALSPRAADILRKIIAAVSTLLFVYLAWAALGFDFAQSAHDDFAAASFFAGDLLAGAWLPFGDGG